MPIEYNVAFIKEDSGDAAADSGTTYELSLGDTFQGALDPANDEDWVQIELVFGTIYDITLTSPESARFQLLDSEGNHINFGNRYTTGSELTFSPAVSGIHYISVYSRNSDSLADYDLSIIENTTPAGTNDEIADYLTDGFWERRTFDIEPGSALTVNITDLTETGQQLARWALEAWALVADIKFDFVEDDDAHITFGDNQSEGSSLTRTRGEVLISSHINIPAGWLIDYGSTLDSFTFKTYLHEIGHALGLGHPGPYNTTVLSLAKKVFLNDSYHTTVMSYFDQSSDTYISASSAHPVTPMSADIIAIQNLYGAPADTHSGDTVYGYQSNVDGYLGQFFRQWAGAADTPFETPVTLTLYDTGGNDTLDLRTDTTDQKVNLHPGGISDVYALVGNLIIARDTVIENFIAGSGDDVVTGNDAANHLQGHDGDDYLLGNGGNDILEGGTGMDRLDGGPGEDWSSYQGSTSGVTVNLKDGTAGGGHAEGDVITGIENVRGSDYADVLAGDSNSNRLYGGDGDDELQGNGGDDVLEGGAGADELDGGAGTDWLSYAGSDGAVSVRLYDGLTARGHAEGDTISGFENLRGSSHPDVLAGTGGANRLEGGAGNDQMWGGSGDDVLAGGAGADRLYGGPGADWITYEESDTGVTVNFSDRTFAGGDAEGDVIADVENVRGSGYADILIGNAGANRLDGGEGDDQLQGNGGDDVLEGGAGIDQLEGGAGTDWVSYQGSDEGVTVNFSDGTAGGGHAEGDIFVDVENIRGSIYEDLLIGDNGTNHLAGGEANDTLEGGAGADQIDGGPGEDWSSYQGSTSGVTVNLKDGTAGGGHAEGDVITGIENVRGSDYADVLAGDSNSNRLYGGDGDDELQGNGGDDVLEGGAGADELDGGAGTDWLSYAGSDGAVSVRLYDGLTARGHAEGDTISGFENLRGSSHPDVLAGTGGANRLEGGAGNDQMWGGSGDDVLAGGAGADRLYGGPGADWITYEESDTGVTVNFSDRTFAGGDAEGDVIADVENVRGSGYADILIGNAGANRLDGGEGDDRLQGNGGDDVLEGGAGIDQLEGGAGADRFYGGSGTDWVSYQGSDEGVTVNFSDGTAGGGHAEGDIFVDVENIRGSVYEDVLIGNDRANQLDGSSGADALWGNGDDDILEGGAGADSLNGGSGEDWASYLESDAGVTVNLKEGTGEAGHAEGDVFADVENVRGSGYADVLLGDDVANRLQGGAGDDELWGNGGNDTLEGGAGKDLLIGGAGADRLFGGDDPDTVSYQGSNTGVTVNLRDKTGEGGHAEGDVIIDVEGVIGSDFGDMLDGDDGPNQLEGRDGNDDLWGSHGDDVLSGGAGDDLLHGNEGNDLLQGGAGDDWLNGYIGDDELWGGDGDDELNGNGGTDRLNGGAGSDIFLFEFWLGYTIISDFTDNQDRIDLTYFELSDIDELAITSDADGVTIDMTSIEGGGTILLENFDIANLDASDFIF